MNTLKRVLIGYLLLLTASCGGSDNTNAAQPVANTLNALSDNTALELQDRSSQPTPRNVKPNNLSHENLETNTEPRASEVAKAEKITIKRPTFSDYIEGGRILKKIKTHYINPNSWLVLYEGRDEFPQLHVILLTPDDNNIYQKVLIDTFDYDGATPQIKELFFANVDNDPEKELIILCTWEVKHQGLGINATDYKVSIYDNLLVSGTNKAQQLNTLMDKFGTGTEGMMEGGVKTYKWKDKASILKAIETLKEPD